MNHFGAQDMVSPLRRVLMKRPGPAMANADPAAWHYAAPLSPTKLAQNHDGLVQAIQSAGAEVLFLDEDRPDLADAVFTHDPSLVTDQGAIILRMGKPLRRREPAIHREFYESQGIPILGEIVAPGTVEAGDCVWLDKATLLVGLSYRTNEAGVEQLRNLLTPFGVAVNAFDLPVNAGAESCLHLMSLISLLDVDLAIVHRPMLPVRLQQSLSRANVECLEAPSDEYLRSGSVSVNVLALAPRQGLMVEGFPRTLALLEDAGCHVSTFPGDELCLKAEGGPTCLTRPILRGR